ncbi:MAG: T9SS type A sorting domain-containing protein [Bacteroidetes bacterium]|nr:T9SS type A sorting domain-containing protein [Bacteroidota bacterium]
MHIRAPVPKRSRREAKPAPVTNGIQVYPQPARDEIRFLVEGPENAIVSLTDLLGRRLREVSVTGNGKSAHGRIGIEGLVPGMYILVVQSERNVRTAKVVIAR